MIVIKVFLSILPIIIIGLLLYKIDIEKEPRKVLTNIFIASVIIGLMGGVITYLLENIYTSYLESRIISQIDLKIYQFVKIVFFIALVEEVCKFIPARVIGMKNKSYSSFYDTIIYFAFSALGFACVENLIYVLTYNVKTAITRAILSVPCHILFQVVMAIFIALGRKEHLEKKFDNNKKSKENLYYALAFIAPITLHSIFNYVITANYILKAFTILLLYLIGIYIIFISKETAKNNSFYVNNNIFKKVLSTEYIFYNKDIIGIISAIIILLGILNTFSVYTFVEEDILMKYFFVLIEVLIIITILIKKKLKKKMFAGINLVLYFSGVIILTNLCVKSFLKVTDLEYGLLLSIFGCALQLIYIFFCILKIRKKNRVEKKEQTISIEINVNQEETI